MPGFVWGLRIQTLVIGHAWQTLWKFVEASQSPETVIV